MESALKCLPIDRELTISEKSLKADAEDGLQKAQAALNGPSNATAVQISDMPWTKVFALKDELNVAGQPSSAHAMMDAFNNWKEGLGILDELKTIPTQSGEKRFTGRLGAVAALSNAILCDPRIFHIPSAEFISKYNQQVMLEVRAVDAWDTEGSKVIQEQAVERLQRLGWDKLRPALATTVRASIIRAHVLLEDKGVFGEWIPMVIEMLEWGRKIWKDVPRAQRGTIFDDTFLLGVRRLHIAGLIESMGSVGQRDTVPEEKLQEIQDVANTILDETSKSKQSAYAVGSNREFEFGFWASFWLYPRGEAQAALGWREMRIGNRKSLPLQERLEHYAEAAELYRDATQCFLPDDEMHLMYRISTLEALWFSRAPLAIVLPYAQAIKPLIPKVKKIWGGWGTFQQLVDRAATVEDFADQAQEAVDRGDVTLEDSSYPEFVAESLA